MDTAAEIQQFPTGDVKIISEGDLKAVTTVIVIDDMFDTCGDSAPKRSPAVATAREGWVPNETGR